MQPVSRLMHKSIRLRHARLFAVGESWCRLCGVPRAKAAEEAARGPVAALVLGRDGGKRTYLWRAVDDEGEVLGPVVQWRRDTEAALGLLRRPLHNQPVEPQTITTDGLASYGAALDQLDLRHLRRPGRLREINRFENAHRPIRRRKRQQQRLKSQQSARKFLTIYVAIYNTFNIQRHLISRPTLCRFRTQADAAWSKAVARFRAG